MLCVFCDCFHCVLSFFCCLCVCVCFFFFFGGGEFLMQIVVNGCCRVVEALMLAIMYHSSAGNQVGTRLGLIMPLNPQH